MWILAVGRLLARPLLLELKRGPKLLAAACYSGVTLVAFITQPAVVLTYRACLPHPVAPAWAPTQPQSPDRSLTSILSPGQLRSKAERARTRSASARCCANVVAQAGTETMAATIRTFVRHPWKVIRISYWPLGSMLRVGSSYEPAKPAMLLHLEERSS